MSTPRQFTAVGMARRTAAILLVFVTVFTALLAGAYALTRDDIAAAESAAKLALINQVLPADQYDNDLLQAGRTLAADPLLGTGAATTAYIARRDGAPVAVLLEAVAPDGYSGNIRLLLAVRHDGTLAGVRVIQHKETPGLGDYIEPKKDRRREKPWITQFAGRSLADPDEAAWKVRKDGGVFDANAGATVSPRAVIGALRRALQYTREHAADLFDAKEPA